MSKVREIITEPSKMYTSETFKVKIRAIRHLTYEEIRKMSVNKLKEYKISELKGV